MQKKIDQLTEKAINEALSSQWDAAIATNEEIIGLSARDFDAVLRLGFAYMQRNDYVKAKKAYQKALRLQPANQIAKSNLQKIAILEKKPKSKLKDLQTDHRFDPNLFLNVTGKTKAITLINIGQANVLAKLQVGQPVELKIKKRHVEVRTQGTEYVGALPDDISKRLIFFLEAKSVYEVYIKEASKNTVDIFIKEIKLGTKVRRYLSFPKNIQDNLKTMGSDDDHKTNENGEEVEEEHEELYDHEAPIDIESLAEQIDETEFFDENSTGDEEDDEV